MKLLLAVLCGAVALAAAGYPASNTPNLPTLAQVTGGLSRVYRRLLHTIAPNQLKISDALHIEPRDGMLASPIFTSGAKGTFNGAEKASYSYKHVNINPEQKGFDGHGMWVKNSVSEMVATYHYGDAIKIHFITTGGIHKEKVLGNPVDPDHTDAEFVIIFPKDTYVTFESLSDNESTFATVFATPALNPAEQEFFPLKAMKTKFPGHEKLFEELAKPGVHIDQPHGQTRQHGFKDRFGFHGRYDRHHDSYGYESH